MRVRLPAGRAGFTLVELMIAMIVGLVVLAAATAVVASTWRGAAGGRMREGIERNARFMNSALNRDLSETGVGIASSVRFGSLSVRNDTIVILSVPYTNGTVASPHTFQYGGAPLAAGTAGRKRRSGTGVWVQISTPRFARCAKGSDTAADTPPAPPGPPPSARSSRRGSSRS